MTARPHLSGALHAAWGSTRTSRAELRAEQDAALRRLAVHAYEQVRYYRRLFDRHRLHPRHLRGAVDLDLVPVSSREDLQARGPGELLARGAEPAALLQVPSSTGMPLYRTWLEDLLQLVHGMRALGGLGLQPRDRIAVVGEREPGAANRHGLALQLLGLHRRRVFDAGRGPEDVLHALEGFVPDVLAGDPAMLDRLAGAPGAGRLRPRLVVVEGRPPMPRLRARLTEAFRAPVRAAYGLGPDTVLATECGETGAYHVREGWVLLEVLVDGRPAAVGERGEVAITFLHAYAMPLLRLRLGHLATRGGLCACGAPFSTILAPDA